jgi:preprotein translocase subunit SecD
MNKIIVIISLCCVGLVLAFLVLLGLSMSVEHRLYAPLSKPPEHGTEFLIEADFSQTPGDTNALASLKQALNGRFSSMGKSAFIELLPPSQLRIDLPTTDNDEVDSISNAIVRRGFLELRMVHDNSDEIIKSNQPAPPGYEVLQSVEVTPGDPAGERLIVKKQAEDGLAGNLIQSALVASANYGPKIDFTLNKDAAARFAKVTTEYSLATIRHRLAIVVDGNVYSAPAIATPITGGECAIAGHFTDEQAHRLVQLLNHPLPVPVKIIEMKSF